MPGLDYWWDWAIKGVKYTDAWIAEGIEYKARLKDPWGKPPKWSYFVKPAPMPAYDIPLFENGQRPNQTLVGKFRLPGYWKIAYAVDAWNKEGVSGSPKEGTYLGSTSGALLFTVEPEVTITATIPSTAEGGLAGQFTVARTGDVTDALVVNYSVSGTATSGSDYTALPGTVTIPAGAPSAQILVEPIDDTVAEPDETVVATLEPGAYAIAEPSSATVTIIDNEPTTVTITATDANAAETGPDPGVFTLSRTGSTAAALTVNYTLSGSTATSGDYQETLSGTATFAAGQASKTITVTPVDDPTVEPEETVVITLTAGSGYVTGTPNNATVRIVDNDTVVSISATVPVILESGGIPSQLIITRTGYTGAPLSVNLTVAGTATPDSDYTALPNPAVIPINESTLTLPVTPHDDVFVEGNETVQVSIAPAPAYTVGTPSQASVTITDDLTDDAAVVTIAASDANAAEAGSDPGTFTISRTGSTTAALTVYYSVSGTASSADYQPSLPGSVQIPAGQASATITITPVDDPEGEGNETIKVTLVSPPDSQATGNYTIGDPAQAVVTIADSDPLVTVTFSPDPLYIAFGGTGQLTANVVPSSAASQIAFEMVDSSIATVSGTAPNLTIIGGTQAGITEIMAKQGSRVVGAGQIQHGGTNAPRVDLRIYKPDAQEPLPEKDEGETKQDAAPGYYITANTNDDDGDGWYDIVKQAPAKDVPPLPSLIYIPDRLDHEVVGGDDDLMRLEIRLVGQNLTGGVRVTYPENDYLVLYESASKVKIVGGQTVSTRVSSGTTFPVATLPKWLYVEGGNGTPQFKDAVITGEYVPGSGENVQVQADKIFVTVFEVSLKGYFGGEGGVAAKQQDDNNVKFSTFKASSDKTGLISWDDKDGDGTPGGPGDLDPNCHGFHNCMECEGTIKPTGVGAGFKFDFVRHKYRKIWGRAAPNDPWVLLREPPAGGRFWDGDEPTDEDEDVDKGNDHIYHIDGPGWDDPVRPPNYLYYAGDLREYVFIEIYNKRFQCANVFSWHAQWVVMPKPNTQNLLTRDARNLQKLGKSWIVIPNNP